jgi:hypothetical protein
MQCGNFYYCAMCHNLRPSLTIIMDNVNHYSKNNNFMSKNLHNAMCQILIYG